MVARVMMEQRVSLAEMKLVLFDWTPSNVEIWIWSERMIPCTSNTQPCVLTDL